jgi:hypothetical protein
MNSEFEGGTTRPLRILHVGNIANNAYLSAKAQRAHGLDAVVVSPRPPFIMGFPEWEEISFQVHDHNHLDGVIGGSDFQSPDWFVSGSWDHIRTKVGSRWGHDLTPHSASLRSPRHFTERGLDITWPWIRQMLTSVIPPKWKPRLASTLLYSTRRRLANTRAITETLAFADIVQLYGPYADVAEFAPPGKPIVALEHGTLRDFVWANLPASRAAAHGYLVADRVMLTNQDCLAPSIRLGISPERIIKGPHSSFAEPLLRARRARQEWLAQAGSPDRTILIPARHTQPSAVDVGKGTDEILTCISSIADRFADVTFQLVEWGDFSIRSKHVLRKAGLDTRVQWLPLLSRQLLQSYMANALCVIDQLTIPAYGGITSDCLGIGVPVITAHDCGIDSAYFGCCAPVLPSGSSAATLKESERVLLPSFDQNRYFFEATTWYDHFLGSDIALNASLTAYAGLANSDRLPDKRPVPPLPPEFLTFARHLP